MPAKYLSRSILERFMDQQQLDKLFVDYYANKKAWGSQVGLRKPSALAFDTLDDWFSDPTRSMSVVAASHLVDPTSSETNKLVHWVVKAAMYRLAELTDNKAY